MLVLKRKKLESIVIRGGDSSQPPVKVTVLEVKGSSVRLGVEADSKVAIRRLETCAGRELAESHIR